VKLVFLKQEKVLGKQTQKRKEKNTTKIIKKEDIIQMPTLGKPT
jgi:hypothetical protein